MVNNVTPTDAEQKLLAFFAANGCTDPSGAAAPLRIVQGASSIEANNHRMVRAVWPYPEDIRSGEKPPAFDFDVDLASAAPDVAALDFLEFFGRVRRLKVYWSKFAQ